MMTRFMEAVLITLIILGQYLFVMRPVRLTRMFDRSKLVYMVMAIVFFFIMNLLGLIYNVNVYLALPVYLVIMVLIAAWQKHDFSRLYRYIILGAVWIITMSFILVIFYRIYNDVPAQYLRTGTSLSDEKTAGLMCMMGLAGYLMILIHQLIYNRSDEIRKVMIILITYNFSILILSGLYFFYTRDDQVIRNVTAFLTAFLVVDYSMLFGISDYVKYLQEKKVKNEMQDRRYAYYLNMEREHLKIRKLYHEMKNYIMYFDKESGREAGFDFENAADRIEGVKAFYQTGNRALDILLHESHVLAEERGIRMNVRIEENCLNFLSDQEINTIFINAIKNAMEASEKITDGVRKIDIRAGHNLNDILIYFKNNVAPDDAGSELRTGKEDKFVHGLGLSNVQNVAENHHGYLSVQRDDNTFQLTILFVNIWDGSEGGM